MTEILWPRASIRHPWGDVPLVVEKSEVSIA